MFGLHLRVCFGMQSLDGAIMANSEQFTIGDPVTFDADGFLIVATAGTRVIGVANQDVTATSDNETVAEAKASYVVADTKDLYEADMSAAITATNRSQYADLTGTTGAVQIDQSSVADNTGQFRIAVLDPRQESSTTRVLVNIAEPEHLAHTQD